MKNNASNPLLLIVAAVILVATAVAVSSGDVAVRKGDRRNIVLPIERTGIDFDLVEAGDTVNGSVTLVNNGEKPVHVLSAKAGCGCTTFKKFEPFTLDPDEKKKIELSVKAPDKPGLRKVKHITFQLKDRDDLKVPLIIETAKATDA